MPRVGVLGSLVWDEIHGRDASAPPAEEWGGIAYALAGMDAALPADWELVPLIKVGRDLAPQAAALLRTLERVPTPARCIEVPVANNRVTLRYQPAGRRCERMSGGVPGWMWSELGPMVVDLDALYVNFISGFEMALGTAQALRHGFTGPIYADLHSLFLGMGADGVRALRPLANAPEWFSYFDIVQINEEEMRQLGDDPLAIAADAVAAGVSLLNVTLDERGVAYVARPGFVTLGDLRRGERSRWPEGTLLHTERVKPPAVDALDPTGCGDVFGATCFARLLAGDTAAVSLAASNRAASRAATLRGAGGLARFLRGELVPA
ncbi:MAG: PfkB family carbohydrate kinase [Gemmatimonadales bacterium]